VEIKLIVFYKQNGPPKRWYSTTTLHSTTQKTVTSTVIWHLSFQPHSEKVSTNSKR